MGNSSPTRNMTIKEKLDYYSIPEPNSGCWLWIGGVAGQGYGHTSINGKDNLAHRVSYEAYNGPIPEGMFVCHKCDTPACINPDHLFLGTPKDNLQDASKKGMMMHGEKHIRAKISEQQAIEIFHDKRAQRVIGNSYGITQPTVRAIKTGKTWKHLKLKEPVSTRRSASE